MTNGCFITGTDTGVGKTRVAQAVLTAAVRAGRRAAGMKPVASGCRVTSDGLRNDDAEVLMRAANVAVPYIDVNPYAFEPAIAPHLAARDAGVEIDPALIQAHFERLARQAEYVVVEGAGGWLVPIGPRQTMADVACTLALPVVLVVGLRLGCLNHAVLTRDAIAHSGLSFAGWVANGIDPAMVQVEQNLLSLAQRFGSAPLAVVPHGPEILSAPVIEKLQRALIDVEQISD